METDNDPKNKEIEMKEQLALLKELVHTEEISTKEAITAYDNSIKRLQSMLTIEGVILALLVPSIIYAEEWMIPQTFLVASAIIISADLIVTGYGLFHKRTVLTIVDIGGFISAGGDTELKYLRYAMRQHEIIQQRHNAANEDVWRYIALSNILLIIAVLSMMVSTISILSMSI